MSFRNISAWAIRNPVAPIVLFIALTMAGIVSRCPSCAPRTGADLVRPEVTIKPRLDLAADLGVTTQAFSLTAGIETWLGPRLSRWLTNGGEGAAKPLVQPAE